MLKIHNLFCKWAHCVLCTFNQILKEEVHDLLDPNPPIAIKCDVNNGFGTKAGISLKPPIQIRENTNGEITLAGVTDVDVKTLEEMASCLERGSLCRATASTNMNSRSRSALYKL
jgi:kinesin family protein 4/21/27